MAVQRIMSRAHVAMCNFLRKNGFCFIYILCSRHPFSLELVYMGNQAKLKNLR